MPKNAHKIPMMLALSAAAMPALAESDANMNLSLNIIFAVVAVATVTTVTLLLLKARKNKLEAKKVVRLCRSCGKVESRESPAALTECTVCDPPALYCADHIGGHKHRK